MIFPGLLPSGRTALLRRREYRLSERSPRRAGLSLFREGLAGACGLVRRLGLRRASRAPFGGEAFREGRAARGAEHALPPVRPSAWRLRGRASGKACVERSGRRGRSGKVSGQDGMGPSVRGVPRAGRGALRYANEVGYINSCSLCVARKWEDRVVLWTKPCGCACGAASHAMAGSGVASNGCGRQPACRCSPCFSGMCRSFLRIRNFGRPTRRVALFLFCKTGRRRIR